MNRSSVACSASAGTSFVDDGWLVLIAALAGATDVDAITLRWPSSPGRDLAEALAVTAIVAATVSNTVVKCGLVATLGTRELAKRVAVAAGVVLAVGVTVAILAR